MPVDNPSNPQSLNVFISYSREDLTTADQLDAALELVGINASFDRQGISGGEDWMRRLGSLIRDSDTVVFILSPASAVSKVCNWEVDESARLGKRIIPVVASPLGDTKPPPLLAELNYIFLYPEPLSPGTGFGTGLAQLVKALKTDLDWMREHTRLLQRATEWNDGGRLIVRLLSGVDIEAAKDWVKKRPKDAPAPTELQLDFIRASEQAELERANTERQRLDEIASAQEAREKALNEADQAQRDRAEASRRLVQRTIAGMVISIVLAAFAGAAGLYAVYQKEEAEAQKRAAISQADIAEKQRKIATNQKFIAEKNARNALAARDQSLISQSHFLASIAERRLAAGDTNTGMLLALNALPSPDEDGRRPYVWQAERALWSSMNAPHSILSKEVEWKYEFDTSLFSNGNLVFKTCSGSRCGGVLFLNPDFSTKCEIPDQGYEISLTSIGEKPTLMISGGEAVRLYNECKLMATLPAGEVVDYGEHRFIVKAKDKSLIVLDSKGEREAAFPIKAKDWTLVSQFVDPSFLVIQEEDGPVRVYSTRGVERFKVDVPPGFQIADVSVNEMGLITCVKDNTSGDWKADRRKSNKCRVASLSGEPRFNFETGTDPNVFYGAGYIEIRESKTTVRLLDNNGQFLARVSTRDELSSADVSIEKRYITTTTETDKWALHDFDGRQLAAHNLMKGYSYSQVLFNSERSHAALALADGTVHIVNLHDGKSVAVLALTGEEIVSLDRSVGSGQFYTVGSSGTLGIWDWSGKLLKTVRGLPGKDLVSAPDEAMNNVRFAKWISQSNISLFDQFGNKLTSFQAPDGERFLSVNLSAAHVSATSSDGFITVWTLDAKQVVRLPARGLANVRVAADGQQILIVSKQNKDITTGSLRVYEIGRGVSGGKELFRQGQFGYVIFNKTGSHFMNKTVAHPDYKTRLYDRDGKLQFLATGVSNALAANFSPDGRHVVMFEDNKTALIVSLIGKVENKLEGHTGRIRHMSFSRDAMRILTAAEDGTARVWSSSGELISVLAGHHKRALEWAHFTVDLDNILTGSYDGTVRIWNLVTKKVRILDSAPGMSPPEGGPKLSNDQFLCPNHDCFVTYFIEPEPKDQKEGASSDKSKARAKFYRVRLWTSSGKLLAKLEAPSYFAPRASADGKFIIAGTTDKGIHIWSPEGREIAVLHDGDIDGRTHLRSVEFRRDGAAVLAVSSNGVIKTWSTLDGKLLGRTKIPLRETDVYWSVKFKPDASQFVVDAGNLLRFFSGDGKLLRTYDGSDRIGQPCAKNPSFSQFLEDGKHHWISTSALGISLYDDNGHRLADFELPRSAFSDFQCSSPSFLHPAVSPVADRVVLSWFPSYDHPVVLWTFASSTNDLVRKARSRSVACLSPAERRQYFLAERPPRWCIDQAKPPYIGEKWRNEQAAASK